MFEVVVKGVVGEEMCERFSDNQQHFKSQNVCNDLFKNISLKSSIGTLDDVQKVLETIFHNVKNFV